MVLDPEINVGSGKGSPGGGPVAGHVLLFTIDPIDTTADRRIRLYIDGAAQPTAEEIASLSFEGSKKLQLAVEAIQRGDASEKQVLEGGNALWERLRIGSIGTAIEPLREAGGKLEIRIAVQPSDEALPWEALVDDAHKRLAAAHDYVIIRHPAGKPRATARRGGPLSLLTVVPSRTRLPVDSELAAIPSAFAQQGVATQIGDPLPERVTIDTLRERLEAKAQNDGAPYDILHFIGHGLVGTDGVPKLQLNDDAARDHEISPSSLASLLEAFPPRLVVLNACHSGSAAEVTGLAGFGQELLAVGVQAVVAMQRAIRTDLATVFAIGFYHELAQSGRVDAAVTAGRRRLLQKQSADTVTGFSIPVLFEAPNLEPVFDIAALRATSGTEPTPPPPRPRVNVPQKVVNAVLGGWCVPVLGPSLMTPTRDGVRSPWMPGTLAEALASECKFPEQTVVAAMAQLRERLDHMVLQRVCEHFENQTDRPPLNDQIRKLVATVAEPPAVHRNLATWPVPGFVCSHFDGLLARAFDRHGRPFRAINVLDRPVPPSADDAPLIVHLRGSVDDEASLCLTGADHDRLLDAMTRMDARSAAVSGLVAARNGTCLLLLGATAWDPWLRHLLWRMVPRDSFEKYRLYIAQPHPTDADRAAWGGFEVQWIEEAPEDVVAAITDRVPGATSATSATDATEVRR